MRGLTTRKATCAPQAAGRPFPARVDNRAPLPVTPRVVVPRDPWKYDSVAVSRREEIVRGGRPPRVAAATDARSHRHAPFRDAKRRSDSRGSCRLANSLGPGLERDLAGRAAWQGRLELELQDLTAGVVSFEQQTPFQLRDS